MEEQFAKMILWGVVLFVIAIGFLFAVSVVGHM